MKEVLVVIGHRMGKGQAVARGVEKAGGKAIVIPGMAADMKLGDVMKENNADLGISFCGSGGAGALTAQNKYGYKAKYSLRSVEAACTAVKEGCQAVGLGFMTQRNWVSVSYRHGVKYTEKSKNVWKECRTIDTFNGKQLLEEMDHEMILTMTGGSLENAVGNLFQLMRKQIFQEISYPIVQMEAKEVYFDEVQVQKETERFMFLFMPREKMTFTITARIVVRVKYLKITKEDF